MVLTEVRRGQRVKYPSGGAEITAYLSQPSTPGTHPAMVVIQPVHGLTPYVEVVADDLAERGYVAIAPALYSRLPTITTDSSAGVPPEARALSNQTPDPQVVGDLRAAIDYLQGLPTVGRTEQIGGCGFCAGGRHGLFLGAAEPRLAAFAAFYPTVTDEEPQPHRPTLVWDVIKDIKGSVCVLIGDHDEPTVEKYREKLRRSLIDNGIDYEYHLYSGGVHGFSNGGSDHYQEHIARAAWAVANDYLDRKLK